MKLQYYRQARMRALKFVFPEMEEEGDGVGGRFNYPRPISEPPSPSSSRVTTPAPSEHGSDGEEDDEVDEEKEVSCYLKQIHLSAILLYKINFKPKLPARLTCNFFSWKNLLTEDRLRNERFKCFCGGGTLKLMTALI